MIAKFNQQLMASALSLLLVIVTTPGLEAQNQPAGGSSSYTGQGAPMSQQELDSLVSPIALYPDALVAQILSAATFSDQVAVANTWLQQNKNLSGNALGQAVNQQSWDPSVKALTQFPSVLSNMAQNLAWTSQLGEAYHNQQSDGMAAPAIASTGAGRREPEDDSPANGDNSIPRRPTSHCDSAGESSGRLCSHLQSDGYIRDTILSAEL